MSNFNINWRLVAMPVDGFLTVEVIVFDVGFVVFLADHELLDSADTKNYTRGAESKTDRPSGKQVRHTGIKQYGCRFHP